MIKINIECILDYVAVDGVFNNEIYHYFGGGWDSRSLATCINCGELFVYDEQELYFKKMTLKQRTIGVNCPNCNISLDQTIEKYPESFRTKNNTIGHYSGQDMSIDRKKTIEVWKLF